MAGKAQRDTRVTGGVGMTALMVAAARAIETGRQDALVADAYAEHFVRAAPASAHWPVDVRDVTGGESNPLWGGLGRYFGLRTRVLDDHLLAAVAAGARQMVLLGAGLDSRAYRLDWPAGLVVFEMDQEEVLAFKDEVLTGLAAVPGVTRVSLAADLRHDWTGVLTGAGFDPAAPTAWLAEGLLLYLPARAERRLVRAVAALSAPGSTLAYEIKLPTDPAKLRASPVYTSTLRQTGLDLPGLIDGEPRPDSAGDLREMGWTSTIHTPFEFALRHGRRALPEWRDALGGNRWVFAHRPKRGSAQESGTEGEEGLQRAGR
ncbi:SAM-dependent methyltransferase [Streptomyces sp. DW26H14]|uniref:SAM-dependent methyltransferase n=1 Tax=Streptomyces sp. DW26H14 TaxID=3435395 RepID=UPI00403DD270